MERDVYFQCCLQKHMNNKLYFFAAKKELVVLQHVAKTSWRISILALQLLRAVFADTIFLFLKGGGQWRVGGPSLMHYVIGMNKYNYYLTILTDFD